MVWLYGDPGVESHSTCNPALALIPAIAKAIASIKARAGQLGNCKAYIRINRQGERSET